jgi:hypothetical protein
MTTYNRTITLASTAVTITQDFSTDDSVVVTVNATSYSAGASASITIQSGDVAVSSSTVSIGSSFTITGISAGTYEIYLFLFDKTYGSQQGYVQGTVTQAEVLPASPTANNQTVPSTTTSVSVPIFGGVTTAEAYSLCVTSGLTTNAQVVADRIDAMTPYTGGNFTISSGEMPAAGSSRTYYIYSYRYPAYDGAGQYYYASSFTVTRQSPPADTTPDQFTFTDVSNVALFTTQTSNTITISGINASTSVSVTGGTYSKNGGGYTSSAGTAVNGDTFAVRHTSSGSFSTSVNTTLNVGGVTDTFTSTTLAADTTPNQFTFTDVSNVARSTTQTSNTITISGLNTSTSVSVSGGTYSKNGGAYTSSAGTAVNGDTFAVRHTSSGSFSTSVNTTLNVGGVTDTFTSTTEAAPAIVAPAISSVTHNNATASSVTATVNLSSAGSGGTLEYAQSTVNSLPSTGWQSSASFSHPRNTTRYYWASQNRNTSGFSSSASLSVGYLSPDLSVTLTPTSRSLVYNATSTTFTISDGASHTTYNLEDQFGDSLGSIVGNGTITVTDSAPGWPSPGGTINFTVEGRRSFDSGGDNTYQSTGVSGSISIASPPSDTTPNPFTFTDVTNVARSTTQTSNTITISGINASTSVSVTGGTYSKNGGGYTSSAGTALNGDTFSVRHTSSASYSTSVNTTLVVGGVSDIFTSTTEAEPADTTPNAFDLGGPVADVGASVNVFSNIITVSGINTATSISISGTGSPAYSIDGGVTYTSSSGSVTGGTNVRVRVTSASTASTSVTATLNIGGVTDTFTATTAVGGGGGGSGIPSGGSNYGIEIRGPNGATKVLSPTTRFGCALGNFVSITLTANSSYLIVTDMTNLTTSNSTLLILSNVVTIVFSITREINGFRITNNTNTTYSIEAAPIRF